MDNVTYKLTGKAHKGVRCGIRGKDWSEEFTLGCGNNTHPAVYPTFKEYSFQTVKANNLVLDVVNLCDECAKKVLYAPNLPKLELVK